MALGVKSGLPCSDVYHSVQIIIAGETASQKKTAKRNACERFIISTTNLRQLIRPSS